MGSLGRQHGRFRRAQGPPPTATCAGAWPETLGGADAPAPHRPAAPAATARLLGPTRRTAAQEVTLSVPRGTGWETLCVTPPLPGTSQAPNAQQRLGAAGRLTAQRRTALFPEQLAPGPAAAGYAELGTGPGDPELTRAHGGGRPAQGPGEGTWQPGTLVWKVTALG